MSLKQRKIEFKLRIKINDNMHVIFKFNLESLASLLFEYENLCSKINNLTCQCVFRPLGWLAAIL